MNTVDTVIKFREQIANWKDVRWEPWGVPPIPVHVPCLETVLEENERLVRNAQTEAWLLAGYYRICERHGIAPSSAELIAAAKEVEDEQLP